MRIGAEWDQFEVVPTRFLDAGDTIIMEGRYRGSYRTTGRSTNSQVVHLWLIREDKLIEFRQYTDTAELREVVGSRDSGKASA